MLAVVMAAAFMALMIVMMVVMMAIVVVMVVVMRVRMHMVVMVMHSKNFLSVTARFRARLKYSQFVLIIPNRRHFVKV